MRSLLALVGLAIGWCSLALAQDSNTQTATGKVVLATNSFKFESGDIYEAIAEGNGFSPSISSDYQNFSTIFTPAPFDPSKRFTTRLFFIAKKTGELPLFVGYPGAPSTPQAAYDYKLTIKRLALAKKPLFEKKDSLTKDDPVYQDRNSPHKAYPITLKKDKFYVIDMVRPKPAGFGLNSIDPYLYLEDTKPANNFQKIVARDDDSGGDLNARIVYQAPKDGDFTIIATSLNRVPGEFTLTVRQQE